ncbi:DUF2793 domain-containing protein, partial [Marivita sp. S2033]|uniref:DUF2793 domain-containing protein n=1 Tax=Marivita sp. S2033 TaxID=3373187 RepID=UPI0039828CC8
MSQTTPILSLPYIQPSQAQKHVTHNEALRALDALVQLSVQSRSLTEPPESAAPGARFIVAGGAAGVWAGQDHAVALAQGGGWIFLAPNPGWRAWIEDEGAEAVWQSGAWQGATGATALPDRLGLGTPPDPEARLAVAAPGTVLSHEGAGHRLKLNKAGAGDTSSLLFQSGWTGYAEMGLAGEDAFSIKVSDGTDWTTALRFDPASGAASGAAVSSGPEDANPAALVRAGDGYL